MTEWKYCQAKSIICIHSWQNHIAKISVNLNSEMSFICPAFTAKNYCDAVKVISSHVLYYFMCKIKALHQKCFPLYTFKVFLTCSSTLIKDQWERNNIVMEIQTQTVLWLFFVQVTFLTNQIKANFPYDCFSFMAYAQILT